MKTWTHPELGEVGELDPDLQYWKVWKHLLEPNERWDRLTGTPRESLISTSRANGCPGWKRQDGSPRVGPSCRRCLERLHNETWREVYGRELVESVAHAPHRRDPTKHCVVSVRGCFFVLQKAVVLTVFRPDSKGSDVLWDEADYKRHAVRYFQNTTGRIQMQPAEARKLDINRAAEVWSLALAYGDGAGWSPEDREAVAQRLRSVPPPVRQRLRPTEALYDALEAALEERAVDELELVVDGLADWLRVVELLHGNTAAQDILEHSADIVALAPAPWLALQPLVDERRAQAEGVAAAWWEELDELLGALRLSEVPVVHPAPSTLAAKVAGRVEAPPRLATLWSALRRLGTRFMQPSQPRFAARVAELGGDTATEVRVTGPLPAGVRVFVVDGDHPDGEELTEDWPLGSIWELDHPEDETWLVTVSGDVAGTSLAQVLEAAAADPEARVEVAPLHRR